MQQPGQGQTDHTSNLFWLVGLFAGAAIIIWWMDSRYIVAPVFWLRYYEIDLIRFIAILWSPIANLFHLPSPNIHQLDLVQHYVGTVNPQDVNWKSFKVINESLGAWMRYPIILILFVMALGVGLTQSIQFRHNYSMKTLYDVGKEVWPEITPVASLDLVKENIDQGPWAMSKPPLHFCREHDLLYVKTVGVKKVYLLRQKPAYRLFALQMGPMWKGVHALPIHLKALVVIFMARVTGQRQLAKQFLRQIAASASSGKLDFTGVSEKIMTFENHRIVQWLEKRHAYVSTWMAALLEIARTDGVLASAEFLWLKPVDRRMWYMMSSVGRRTAFVEVAGAYSHWIAEKRVGHALKTPMVKGAVEALDETLQTILYVEEGDQWRTINAD